MQGNKIEVRRGLESPIVIDDPTCVIARSSSGSPMIVVVKIADGTWGISTSADSDWENILKRYGIE